MLIRKRPDGVRAKVPGYTKIVPVLLGSRTESAIYMDQIVYLDKTEPFIAEWNENNPDAPWAMSVMQVLLTAIGRTVAQRPRLNRFVSNYRHYQRNNISVSFVTKKTLSDDGRETNVIMPFRPYDTLDDVNQRFAEYVGAAKGDEGNKTDEDVDFFERLPVPILRFIVNFIKFIDRRNWIPAAIIKMFPMYATVFLTNVGSLKLDAPYHHNFELGNTGIFMALGKKFTERSLDASGNLVERRAITVRYTFDDRIVDGIYSGRAMKLVKEYVENPEKLTVAPKIAPKHIEELKLSEKGWRLWAATSGK
ncbi:MAG: 2-oxo acid dehydrogenase subunit E2 [Spirochaetales bacterium]|nr:2-oxo acid dehydrogenase subunit E2 [Spirochaetales bacterium]